MVARRARGEPSVRDGRQGHPDDHNWLCGEMTNDPIAGLLASAADFSTNLAVLHPMFAMSRALVPTQPAGRCTGLKCRSQHPRLDGRLPGEDAARCIAHIGTVEVEANTAAQHCRVLFA